MCRTSAKLLAQPTTQREAGIAAVLVLAVAAAVVCLVNAGAVALSADPTAGAPRAFSNAGRLWRLLSGNAHQLTAACALLCVVWLCNATRLRQQGLPAVEAPMACIMGTVLRRYLVQPQLLLLLPAAVLVVPKMLLLPLLLLVTAIAMHASAVGVSAWFRPPPDGVVAS
jgi:hypothetical protein